ncbi:MAG: NPCBM/NEW2 domain-containing protein [Planctomycetota bacterium]|nr:NPCBM/NEW2 domain-containing protein [Planctomycetota bacterium]
MKRSGATPSKRVRSMALWSPWIVLALMFAAFPAGAEEITTYTNRWEARCKGLRKADGRWSLVTDRRSVPLEDVVHIRYSDQLLEGALPQVMVWLVNGDRLAGSVIEGSALGLTIKSSALPRVKVGLERIRALVFPHNIPADHTVATATDRLLSRESRRDVVVLRAGSETQGIIQRFGVGSLEISTERLGNLTIPYEKVSAVRVFEETPAPKATGLRIVVCLTDGSRITGKPKRGDEKVLEIESTGLGTLRIPTSRILLIYLLGGRFTYLSDLEPVEVKATPFFPGEFPWRPYLNRDQGYGGGPITLAGVVYPKGLGCHSKVEATYAVSGYRILEGLLGIDDEVAGGKGSVIFKVLLDGREVYSSGEVTHGQEPKSMQVDIAAAKTFTLVVEYGKNIHIQDRADWADIRVSR